MIHQPIQKLSALLFTSLFTILTMAQSSNDSSHWMQPFLKPNPNYLEAKASFDSMWHGKKPKKGGGYKQFLRWEYRAKDRMDSNGIVHWNTAQLQDFLDATYNTSSNGGGNLGENIHIQKPGIGASPCPGLGRWEPVGPTMHPYNQSTQPTGVGRVAGIAFHPTDSNTFYAMAPQGGLYKTTNAGATWNYIFGNGTIVNTIGVSCMLISYNNTDTLYIGTGDRDAGDAPGFGVLMSPNGGKNWYARNTGISNLIVAKMVMDPKNSKIIIIATNGGIYRTTDGGSTWSQRVTGSWTDIVMHPTNRQYLYAATGGRFYRSTDNGVSWTLISSGLPTTTQRGQIAVSPAKPGYVYFVISISSYYQGTYRSTDSGTSFTSMSTSPNILGYYDGTSGTSDLTNGQGWYDLDIAADKLDADKIYVGGVNVWKSTNGGSTWTQVAHWYGGFSADDVHADQHATEVAAVGRKIFSGNDGGIYYSMNEGKTWTNITNGLMNSQIYRLSVSKTNEFISAQGYQDNGSAQSRTDRFITYYGGDGMDCQVDPSDATYVYGAYVYGSLYRSVDYGPPSGISTGISESGAWLTPFVLREGTPATMFAGYVNVWRNTNVKSGTPSWTKISSGWGSSVSWLENSMADSKILFAIGNGGKLMRTTDATVASPSWTDLSSGQPSGIKRVETHPKNSSRIYCINNSNLYRSNDQGVTWSGVGTMPSGAGVLQALYLDTTAAKETIYIGTERGVYVWDSASLSIKDFSTGFPLWADVTDLDIYYAKDKLQSKLVASTYGKGVWKSNLYEDGSSAPVSDFYAFDSVYTVGGTATLYEKIKNSASSVVWKIKPYSYSYVNGTDSTSLIPQIKFNASSAYTVSLIATNCQGSHTKTKIAWLKVFPAEANANCINSTTFRTSNNHFGLRRISFSDNNNETGGYFDDGEYADFTSTKVFRVKPSTSYTTTLRVGDYNSENIRIFIDYDNNGKFENYKSEAVVNSGASTGIRTVTLTMPSTLKKNQALRMRVLDDFSSLDTNACKSLSYGTGEDYSLVYESTVPYFKADKLTACTGQTVTFTDTSFGVIGDWQWNFGSGATPATATGKGPHNVTYSTTGAKNVKLKVNGTDSITKTSYVTISGTITPQIRVKSGSLTSCEGQNITLAVKDLNGSTTAYQWKKNGVDISGKTDTLLSFNPLSSSDAGTYTCLLSNLTCSSLSSGLTIVVNPKPVANFSINNNAQCFKYNSVVCTNSSTITSGTMSSFWNMGDGNTQTTTNATRKYLTVNTFNIKLVQTSNNSCKDSITKTVTIYPSPTVNYTLSATAQCINKSFTFTNSSTVSAGTLTYNWAFGDGGTSTATSPTYTYTASGTFGAMLIATTNNSCKDTTTKSVTVYAKPVPNFTINNATQCLKGNSFVYTNSSTGASSYLWKLGNGGTTTTTNASEAFTTANTYSIKLIATSSNSCIDSVSKTVTVNPKASLAFTINNATQCLSGNSFVFTNSSSISSGTLGYNWAFGDGGTSTSTSPTYSYSSAGSYSVMLISTSSASCKDTLTKSVTVNASPVPNFTINNSGQCLKGNSFTYTNTSTGATSYLWRLGNGNTSTSTNNTVKYTSANTYSVRLIATHSNGCIDSITKSITVYPQANLAYTINNTSQCISGNSFTFTNSSTISSGTLSYLWNYGNGITSSATSPTYSYPLAGTYTVNLFSTSNNNCKDTLAKSLTVHPKPSVDFTINNAAQCLKGNSFVYTSTSSISSGTINLNWSSNSVAKTGSPVTYNYGLKGNYAVKLIATSNQNCKDSITKNVDVWPQASTKFTVNDSDQCELNHKFIFTSTSTVSAGSISSYNWNYGDLTTGSGSLVNKIYSEPGEYLAQLFTTTDKNCKDTANKKVIVYEMPLADFFFSTPTAQCFKGHQFKTGNHSVSADPIVLYSWNFGNSNTSTLPQPTITYASAGTYSINLSVTTNKGCIDDTTIKVTVYPQNNPNYTINTSSQCKNGNNFLFTNTTSGVVTGTTYNWQYGDGANSNGTNGNRTYASHGNYSVLLISTTPNNCKDTISKAVTVYASPIAGYSINKINQCFKNHQFIFTNTSSIPAGTMSEKWTLGDNTSATTLSVNKSYSVFGLYTVKLVETSNNGCKDSITQSVEVYADPKADFAWAPTEICENELVKFANNSTIASGTNNYKWNFGNSKTASTDTASTKFATYGNYTIKLIATTNHACMDSISKSLTIKSIPLVNFTANPNPACALQQNVIFTSTGSNPDGNAVSYKWDFADGNTGTNSMENHLYASANNYNTNLTVNNGKCVASLNKTVIISPKVFADFDIKNLTKETIYFSAKDTLTPGYSYQWIFGDDSSGSGSKTNHLYEKNGDFFARLVVTNTVLGCTDTLYKSLTIKSPLYYEQKNEFNFYVFPNPSNGIVTYKFFATVGKKIKVKVFDVVGQRELFTENWDITRNATYHQSINFKAMGVAPGTYPVQISDENHTYVVKIVYIP